MSQQPNSVLANGENLAIGTGELNDVQSNNNSSKEQKDMVTTMTINTNSTFVRKSINSKSLFVNEPLTQSETGDRLPIRDEMVAGLQLRIWDDLFCVVGQYGEGVFEVSLRTYEQITALITSLESLKVGKGTWRKGLHSHYNISDVEFVGDRIPSFAYVRFSRLSKADAKLLASHGIKDDGKHQDRWVVLSAAKGRLQFNYAVTPHTPRDFVEHMKTVFDGTTKSGRKVESAKDLTKLDWDQNKKAWSQQHRHDVLDTLLNVAEGKQVIRVAPTLFERSNGNGFSVQEQAEHLATGLLGLLADVDTIVQTRKQRIADINARKDITNMVFALGSDKYDVSLSDEVAAEIKAGTITIVKNGKKVEVEADTLLSQKRGDKVKLQMVYADGKAPMKGNFFIFDGAELAAAVQKAANRQMYLAVVK